MECRLTARSIFVAMLQESCTRDRTGRRSSVGALERRGPESVSSLDRTIEFGSLKEESRLLWGLGHENIVSLLGLSMQTPDKCFVMEYAQGGSLHDVLMAMRIRPDIIVDWVDIEL